MAVHASLSVGIRYFVQQSIGVEFAKRFTDSFMCFRTWQCVNIPFKCFTVIKPSKFYCFASTVDSSSLSVLHYL